MIYIYMYLNTKCVESTSLPACGKDIFSHDN